MPLCDGEWIVREGNGFGFGDPIPTGVKANCAFQHSGVAATQVADVSGDGVADVVFLSQPNGEERDYRRLSYNEASGGYATASLNVQWSDEIRATFLDANGDGVVDLVTHAEVGSPPFVPGLAAFWTHERMERMGVFVRIGHGDGSFAEPTLIGELDGTPPEDTWWFNRTMARHYFYYCVDGLYSCDGLDRRYANMPLAVTGADINGDFRGDLLIPTLPHGADLATITAEDPHIWEWDPAEYSLFTSTGDSFTRGDFIAGTRVLERQEVDGKSMVFLRQEMLSADVDGDGILDNVLYEIRQPEVDERDAYPPEGSRIRTKLNRLAAAERMSAVTNGLGERTEINYRPSSDASVVTPANDCVYPQRCDSGVRWVVSGVTHDAAGTPASRSYQYEGARTDLVGRGWLGFSRRTEINHATGVTTTHHMDNVTRESERGIYPGANRPNRIVTYIESEQGDAFPDDSLKAIGTVTDTTYVTIDHEEHPQHWSVRTSDSATSTFTSMSPLLIDPTKYDCFDTFTADHIETTHVDLMTPADPSYHPLLAGVPTRVMRSRDGALQQTVETAYEVPHETTRLTGPRWFVGQQRSTRTIGADDCNSDTAVRYNYADGILESVIRSPDELSLPRSADDRARVWLRTSFIRDGYGNVVAVDVEDAWGEIRSSTYGYDEFSVFVTSATNPLGHMRSRTVEQRFGTTMSTTNANGLTTYIQRDGFGRPTLIDDPTDADTTITILDDALGIRVQGTTNGYGTVERVLDPAGREISSRRQVARGSSLHWATVERQYDAAGRLIASSAPRFDWETPVWDEVRRDGIGAVRQTVRGGDVLSDTWLKTDQVFQRDAVGAVRHQQMDGFGRTLASFEPMGATTSYQYCADGRVKATFDAEGNRTGVVYDSLGRRVELEDPDTGITQIEWNAFGETTRTVDQAGRTADYVYDALSRVVVRFDVDGVTQFGYDESPNGIGELTWAYSADNIGTAFQYDGFGRVAGVGMELHDGRSFGQTFRYDEYARLTRATYPTSPDRERLAIDYSYATNGELLAVADGTAGGFGELWRKGDQTALGQTSYEVFGNGAKTYRDYDPVHRWLRNINTSGLQDWTFSRDNVGRIKSRVDAETGFSETFEYDALGRLTEANPSEGDPLSFAYDVLGNLTFASDVGPIAYDGDRPHLATEFMGVPQNYDAVGNHLGDPVRRTVDVTATNLPRRIIRHDDGEMLEFLYDAFGTRTVTFGKDADATGPERVSFGAFELRGEREVVRVSADGRIVAELQQNRFSLERSVAFLHDDHLGSVDAVSGMDGPLAKYSYSAFGKKRDLSFTFENAWDPGIGDMDFGFTGHEHDDGFGLINMRGRTYDPAMRRMMSADPFVVDPFGSQSYNRYSYVENDPLNMIDPTGYQMSPADQMARRPRMPNSEVCTGECNIEDVVVEGQPNRTPTPAQDRSSRTESSPSQVAAVTTQYATNQVNVSTSQRLRQAAGRVLRGQGEFTAGLVTGFVAAFTPGAFIATYGMEASGFNDPLPPLTRLGIGVGETAGGLAQIALGTGAAGLGGGGTAATAGGAGPVGLPLVSVGATTVAAGAANTATGAGIIVANADDALTEVADIVTGGMIVRNENGSDNDGGGASSRPQTLNDTVGDDAAGKVRSALKGDVPLSALSAQERARAAAWYREVAERTVGTRARAARLYNIARAEFLEGSRSSLPRTLPDFIRSEGL